MITQLHPHRSSFRSSVNTAVDGSHHATSTRCQKSKSQSLMGPPQQPTSNVLKRTLHSSVSPEEGYSRKPNHTAFQSFVARLAVQENGGSVTRRRCGAKKQGEKEKGVFLFVYLSYPDSLTSEFKMHWERLPINRLAAKIFPQWCRLPHLRRAASETLFF